VQQVRLRRVLLVAAVSALIPLAGKVIQTFLTEQTSAKSWLVVPAVGVAVAMVAALVDAFGSAEERGETPLIVALVVSVVVIGLGGLLAGEAARKAAGAIKGSTNEQALAPFVLTSADLPDGYTRVSTGSCAAHFATDSVRKILSKMGFKRCVASVFHKKVSKGTFTANNDVASVAYLVRDNKAASELLPVLRSTLLASRTSTGDSRALTPRSLPAVALGDEAPPGFEAGSESPSLGDKVTSWVYIWRRGSIAAFVFSTNATGDFDRLGTLDLARIIDQRAMG
jgi:hypothetical protein